MSGLVIQSAALDKVKELKLDQHEHEHSYFAPTFSKTWTCNEGNVHTREVCEVIANYTAESMFDLSYVAYRIMNAVKAIFNCSDWQKIVRSVVEKSPFASIKVIETTVYKGCDRSLRKALNLNWKNEEAVKLEEPKECEQKNIVLR